MDKTVKEITLDYAIEIASLTEINSEPLYDEITCQNGVLITSMMKDVTGILLLMSLSFRIAMHQKFSRRINYSISSTPYSGICIYVLTIMATFLLLSI